MDGTEVGVKLWVIELTMLECFVVWDTGSKIVQIFNPLEQQDSASGIKSSALRSV